MSCVARVSFFIGDHILFDTTILGANGRRYSGLGGEPVAPTRHKAQSQLSPPATPAQETTIGLAGIAALSPAATALSSYQEAADVTDRLLVCLDSSVSMCGLLAPIATGV